MKRALSYLLSSIMLIQGLHGQRTCGSHIYYQDLHQRYPEMFKSARGFRESAPPQGSITIPVVVHIIYNTPEQNLSTQDILSQLNTLNQDFQGVNRDIDRTPAVFRPYLAGDCQIRFVLDTVFRKKTNVRLFNIDLDVGGPAKHPLTPAKHPIKFTRFGGEDAFYPTKYLNIWVGNIQAIHAEDPGLLGLGTFPGSPTEFDGVIIYYQAFGNLHATSPYDRGRTATHEIGHWLNLIHISGDSYCGDDSVEDTPVQQKQNYGSPLFPLVNCTKAPGGAMFMNYMDYVDDSSMFMFTQGQKARMRAVFAPNGFRRSFIAALPDTAVSFLEEARHPSPVISAVAQTHNLAAVKWTAVKNADEYEVVLRELKSDQLQVRETKENIVHFTGLAPEGLYEVEVTAKFGVLTATSLPYRFIAYKSYFSK